MKLNLYFAAPEISIGNSARLKMKWSKNSMVFMQCTNVFQKNKFSIFLIKGNNCLGQFIHVFVQYVTANFISCDSIK